MQLLFVTMFTRLAFRK